MARLKNTVERSMFYGAKSEIFKNAEVLRANPTIAEQKLWEILIFNDFPLGIEGKKSLKIKIQTVFL